MNPAASILLVDQSPAACAAERAVLDGAGFPTASVASAHELLETLYHQPPALILMSAHHTMIHGATTLDALRSDSILGHLPVLLLLQPGATPDGIDWGRIAVDDYLVRPCGASELLTRVRLILARVQRDMNANPLTGLPGNRSIMREIERRLAAQEAVAVAYLDIDNFKPYNDKYGFTRGDEVLRMTTRIITHTLDDLAPSSSYAGHIGGDDFLFITPPAAMEQACKEILRNFDLIVPNFYDEEDRARDGIHSVDRQGNPRQYPLMTCTIAVIDTARTEIPHVAELAARAAEVKQLAKGLAGSNYLFDRRR
ncbi:MAG: diguanylate cyclase [Candidatus Hydrogenedentes bacterium]|nr:diguanylate cyclase [Candidatus Hydrogenedentota bacterium]